MSGYENLLAIVCHAGPPVYGCQAYRLKVINMEERNYSVVVDTECPVSRDSVINWLGFSEEGQFMTLDTEGVLRAFNFRNHQWIPCLDFKSRSNRVWITGVTDSEVLAIEMNAEQSVPILA